MKVLDFIKLQGAGNDFIVADALDKRISEADLTGAASRLCDRHFGIGADGIILVLPSEIADYRMSIINSDGSVAEMCGNGIRCFVRYLADRGKVSGSVAVETLTGIRKVDIVEDGFSVNMGAPMLNAEEIPIAGFQGRVISQPLDVDGVQYDITCVSMGNPHCVIFTDSVDDIPLETIGPKIETHSAFPKKTNVEFVQILGSGEVKVRVWERGCGITLACGTGTCASVVAGVLNKQLDRKALAHLPGGDLLIDWRDDGDVYMTGPAEEVFTGRVFV